MNPSFLVLLSFLLGGGSGELLDYVPTQSYWRDRSVDITVDSMLHEAGPKAPQNIAAMIADVGAEDPHVRDAAAENILKLGPMVLPQLTEAAEGSDPEIADRSAFLIKLLRPRITVGAVRRLMALRTLGELKNAKALPFLQSQLASGEMFVADYARSAIGAINGHIDRPAPKDPLDSVWLLPSNCRAVAQLVPRGNGPVDADQAAARIAVRPGQNSAQLVANLSRTALNVAEQLGDMRLDTLSVGVSENIDDGHGCVTFIASGKYDAANAARVMRGQNTATRAVDGVDIFEPDAESTIILPSDHELVMLVAPAGEQTPLHEMIGAIKTRQPTLRNSREMVALVEPMLAGKDGAAHALWIAVKVTDAYRKLVGLDGFETLRVIGDEKDGALNLVGSGHSADAATAAAALVQLRRLNAESIALAKNILPAQPFLEPAISFLSSLQLQSNGDVVTGAGVLRESPAGALYVATDGGTSDAWELIVDPKFAQREKNLTNCGTEPAVRRVGRGKCASMGGVLRAGR